MTNPDNQLQEKLEAFAAFLLEKEMLLTEELSKGAGSLDPFFHGAYTYVSYIRSEFKNQFLTS